MCVFRDARGNVSRREKLRSDVPTRDLDDFKRAGVTS